MKRIQAIIAATIVTGIIAVGMLAVGINAVFNPNTVPVSDSPAQAPAASNVTATDPQAQGEINRLQSLVSQYQSREKQYQAQVDQLNSQVQQLQGVLDELQQRGVIRINRDGSIQLGRGRDR